MVGSKSRPNKSDEDNIIDMEPIDHEKRVKVFSYVAFFISILVFILSLSSSYWIIDFYIPEQLEQNDIPRQADNYASHVSARSAWPWQLSPARPHATEHGAKVQRPSGHAVGTGQGCRGFERMAEAHPSRHRKGDRVDKAL